MRCNKCELYETSKFDLYSWSKLDGLGNSNYVMFIGSYPWIEEIKQKRPFVNEDAKFLQRKIQMAGLEPEKCYYTYLIKCKPIMNEKIKDRQIKACEEYLLDEIKNVKPKVIVPLGEMACKWLLNEGSIGSIRGGCTWNEKLNCWVVPTYDPFYVRKSSQYGKINADFLSDLGLVKKTLVQNEQPPSITIHKIENVQQFKELVGILLQQPAFAWDTETTSLDYTRGKLLCFTFAYNNTEGYFLPYNDSRFWGYNFKSELFELLQKLFLSPCIKIGQNIKFDINFIRWNGFKINLPIWDTMVGAYLLDENAENYNLNRLTLRYTIMESYKDVLRDYIKGNVLINENNSLFLTHDYKDTKRKSTILDAPIDDYINYAGKDAVATFQCYQAIKKELMNDNLIKLAEKIVFPAIRAISTMELNGVVVDKDKTDNLCIELLNQTMRLEKELQNFKDVQDYIKLKNQTELNFRSPKQFSDFLFNFKGFKVNSKCKKSKQGSTNEETLLEILKQTSYPLLERLLEYRKTQKLYKTYAVSYKDYICNSIDGRIRSSFNMTIDPDSSGKSGGSVTGRLSSHSPNLQNYPVRSKESAKIKELFICLPKAFLVAADFKQIEFRIAVHMANDSKLISILNDNTTNKNFDIHKYIASQIFNLSIDKVTGEQRTLAKTAVFGGLLYGGGAYIIERDCGVSRQRSEHIFNTFFERFPKLKEFSDGLLKDYYSKGFVTTLFGRRRRLNDLLYSNDEHIIKEGERQALNSPVQGTAADLMFIAMNKIDQEISNTSIQLVNQIHDALYFYVHEETLKEDILWIKQKMENPIKLSVPIIVDIQYGKNLAEMQEYDF